MKTRKVTRYIAECGKGFWNKASCQNHESICNCWTNPAFRTCKTCAFSKEYTNSNGMESEPNSLEKWREIECANLDFDYENHFNQAHEKAPTLCINCTKWKWKKGDWEGGIKNCKIL